MVLVPKFPTTKKYRGREYPLPHLPPLWCPIPNHFKRVALPPPHVRQKCITPNRRGVRGWQGGGAIAPYDFCLLVSLFVLLVSSVTYCDDDDDNTPTPLFVIIILPQKISVGQKKKMCRSPPPPPPTPRASVFLGLARSAQRDILQFCPPPPPPSKHHDAVPDPNILIRLSGKGEERFPGGGGHSPLNWVGGAAGAVQNLTLSQTARRTKNTLCHNIPY